MLKAMATEMSIYPAKQDPIIGEDATRLIIVNEGAGAFFEINQEGSGGGKVQLTLEEISMIHNYASKMFGAYDTAQISNP